MSVVALRREHASIFKAPILHEVDMRIFGLRYFTHCMACTFCNDQCCSYGVDIDFDNAQKLRGIGLWCRRDYDVNRAWPRFGFVPLDDRPGRSLDGKELTF